MWCGGVPRWFGWGPFSPPSRVGLLGLGPVFQQQPKRAGGRDPSPPPHLSPELAARCDQSGGGVVIQGGRVGLVVMIVKLVCPCGLLSNLLPPPTTTTLHRITTDTTTSPITITTIRLPSDKERWPLRGISKPILNGLVVQLVVDWVMVVVSDCG